MKDCEIVLTVNLPELTNVPSVLIHMLERVRSEEVVREELKKDVIADDLRFL